MPLTVSPEATVTQNSVVAAPDPEPVSVSGCGSGCTSPFGFAYRSHCSGVPLKMSRSRRPLQPGSTPELVYWRMTSPRIPLFHGLDW